MLSLPYLPGECVDFVSRPGIEEYGIEPLASLTRKILGILAERSIKLAVAESCTGGRLADALTDIPGASAVFLGGVIAYDNSVKIAVLGVSADSIKENSPVSMPVVKQMATGAIRATGASLGLAVVGYAGPGADPVGTVPVGTVHAALDGLFEAQRSAVFKGERLVIKEKAAKLALELLLNTLDEHPRPEGTGGTI